LLGHDFFNARGIKRCRIETERFIEAAFCLREFLLEQAQHMTRLMARPREGNGDLEDAALRVVKGEREAPCSLPVLFQLRRHVLRKMLGHITALDSCKSPHQR
jgi:hypothetical protein